MECCYYLQSIQDLVSEGKTPVERRFGMSFNGPVRPFGAMVEYYCLCERLVEITSICAKSLARKNSSVMYCMR